MYIERKSSAENKQKLYFTQVLHPLLRCRHLCLPRSSPVRARSTSQCLSSAACWVPSPALPDSERRRLFGSLTNSFLAGGAGFLSDENVTLCSHSELFPEHSPEWAAIPPICSFRNVLCQSHAHIIIVTGSVQASLKCFLIFLWAGISPWFLIRREWNVHSC